MLSCFTGWQPTRFGCRDTASPIRCQISRRSIAAPSREAFYDVTAISFHAYPYLQDNYTLMGCGGSVGEGYGPMVVSGSKLSPEDLSRIRVAIPGTLTTAYLALKIFNPELETVIVPFDKIIPEILAGNYDAGLIIHEGQLTYRHQRTL